MQMQPSLISPSEAFDLFYFIRNHTDDSTYYVRSVIYDVRTGEVLTTVNLDRASTNTRLYIKSLQAPADPVGLGRNIVAVATVYTDSAYTTKSSDYEEQEQYFLIRAVAPFAGGGGGFDIGPLKEWFKELLDKRLSALPKPAAIPDMPFDQVFGAIGTVQREINRVPKDATHLEPVTSALEALKAQIEAIPPPEKVDLGPIATALRQVLSELQAFRKDNTHAASSMIAAHQGSMGSIAKDIAGKIIASFDKELKDLMGKQELTIPLHSLIQPKQPVTQDAGPPDLSHLTG